VSKKSRLVVLAAVVSAVLAVGVVRGCVVSPSIAERELAFSAFLEMVDKQPRQIKPDSLVIELHTRNDADFRGEFTDGSRFFSTGYLGTDVLPRLAQAKLGYHIVRLHEPSAWKGILVAVLPAVVLIGLMVFLLRGLGTGGGLANFRKSTARRVSPGGKRVTFADVAGIEEAQDELAEIIGFLSDPKKYTRLGGRIPKGVLMMGPPGTGKTLLARAIAGEADVPFFSISGSDFVEMFVGVGASRARDLFAEGKANAPCIIFIDEIDAVGRQRGTGLGGGHDEREQTLNQLLVEMDGFESNEGVILIAATNRPDVLDPALLRPGRFDRRIVVSRPDVRGRHGILKVHTRKTPLASDVDLEVLARGTPGFAGAELGNLVNEAALFAARSSTDTVQMRDFELAKDKVLMGVERRSLVVSPKERRAAAYREAGHALVGKLLHGTDPIHKVSIVPRGQRVGLTQQLPVEDRLNFSKEMVDDQIALLMGGRVAEETVLGQVTTGSTHDIMTATDLARRMACQWGMSELLGPVNFGGSRDSVFVGRDLVEGRGHSEKSAGQIDREVHRIVTDNQDRARHIILSNLDKLATLAEALLEFETIAGFEIDGLWAGQKIVRPPLATPAT
jgi:cell division protease FtsH